MVKSPIRDLAEKIESLARDHPASSQAHSHIQTLVDHLCAIAFIEERRWKEVEENRYDRLIIDESKVNLIKKRDTYGDPSKQIPENKEV